MSLGSVNSCCNCLLHTRAYLRFELNCIDLHGVVLHFLVFTFLTVCLLVHLWLAASDLLTASRTIEFLLTSGGPGSEMHHDESSWLQIPLCHMQLCTSCTWAQRCPPKSASASHLFTGIGESSLASWQCVAALLEQVTSKSILRLCWQDHEWMPLVI